MGTFVFIAILLMSLVSPAFPTLVSLDDHKLLQSSSSNANIMVAKDGSGNFATIMEAVAMASNKTDMERCVIYIKGGIYVENIKIETKNIILEGDGIGNTIITGNRSYGTGFRTFDTATVIVAGEGFIARGITFRNTAGPQNGQAVALRADANHSVFYQCSFEGYQDTLYAFSGLQYYKECDIYGTVDIIFGNAAVVFQDCNIVVRNSPAAYNIITAQGRSRPNDTTGFIFHNCIVTGASNSSTTTYLGRPWGNYSQTVYIESYLDELIDSAGWTIMYDNSCLSTVYFGEYDNKGPGASTAKRVKWDGYHIITNTTEISKFTVDDFISEILGCQPPMCLTRLIFDYVCSVF